MLRGAEVFTIDADWLEARQSHRRTLVIARAIKNKAHVLAANRAGPAESGSRFSVIGGSIRQPALGLQVRPVLPRFAAFCRAARSTYLSKDNADRELGV